MLTWRLPPHRSRAPDLILPCARARFACRRAVAMLGLGCHRVVESCTRRPYFPMAWGGSSQNLGSFAVAHASCLSNGVETPLLKPFFRPPQSHPLVYRRGHLDVSRSTSRQIRRTTSVHVTRPRARRARSGKRFSVLRIARGVIEYSTTDSSAIHELERACTMPDSMMPSTFAACYRLKSAISVHRLRPRRELDRDVESGPKQPSGRERPLMS